ncbi:YeeE/YedE family protein [Celeribacter sp.]|uniref:YeeE/YedE family protein n=1 Tax=Celeribacter sp. TaxID=1890673 RepID=UPI003A8EF2EF
MITEFTPWASLIGGILIGLSAVFLMAFQGRVFGATGVLAGFMTPQSSSDWTWRAWLLAGMVSGPLVYRLIAGEMPAIDVPVSNIGLIVGGIIVGLGVTFGSGCTSGHGVCGMARLSPRSIAATVTFMIFTAITVFVVRHVLGGV